MREETAGGENKRQAERRNGKRRKETAGGEKNGRQGKEMAGRGKQQQARKRQFLCGEVEINVWKNIIYCNKFKQRSQYDHWIVPAFFLY